MIATTKVGHVRCAFHAAALPRICRHHTAARNCIMGSGASDQIAGPDEHTPRNILLTGGAGFIGAHVVAALLTRFPQYKVVVLDKLDYCASYANISKFEGMPNFRWCRGDIRSKCLVEYLLRSENIDTILHFAASTHVDNSFNSSISFTSNNVVGTHVLLESARVYGKIERFIHVSTDEVYGGETNGETEESMLLPTNPYACTKAAAELICNGYAASFGLPIVMTRGNNVYGPLQYPDKFIAKASCLLARGQKVFIHGDGTNLRNYVYVTDMADAFVVILHRGKTGSVYNVGSDTEKSNIEVARDLVRICGKGPDIEAHIEHVVDREMNDRRYHIDSTKLFALGWAPAVSWEEGLRKTSAWYANPENLNRWKSAEEGLVPHPVMPSGVTDDYI
jgi:dTDP-glucose 4,6-dehydratase